METINTAEYESYLNSLQIDSEHPLEKSVLAKYDDVNITTADFTEYCRRKSFYEIIQAAQLKNFNKFENTRNKFINDYKEAINNVHDNKGALSKIKDFYDNRADFINYKGPYPTFPIKLVVSLPEAKRSETKKEIKIEIVKKKRTKTKDAKDIKEKLVEKGKSKPSPKKILSPNKVNTLNSSLQGIFPFKSVDECVSKATSKPYYISKKDLLAVISNNKPLKDRLGSKYTSLSKEELCKKIFNSP